MTDAQHRDSTAIVALLLPILALFTLLAGECLFFFTKPSFLSSYSAAQTLMIWVEAVTIVVAVCLLPWAPFLLWRGLRRKPVWPFLLVALRLLAAMVLAVTSLLLIDNFSLTMLDFGVRDSHGILRGLYLVLLLGLCGYWGAACLRSRRWSRELQRTLLTFTIIILAPGVVLLSIASFRNIDTAHTTSTQSGASTRPNILLINGDGINARSMSAYGYQRDTTPFLKSMLGEMLVADNNFTNASDTAGSIVALLTGKEAVTTRVIYPPDVLRGEDAYQHLPGLLRQIGYRTINISLKHYADPFDINMRGAFDVSNGRETKSVANFLQGDNRLTRSAPLAAFFLGEVMSRISQRLAHIAFLSDMPDDFAEITQKRPPSVGDPARIEQLKTFIGQSRQPFFAHVHLMGTHGDKFHPLQQRWSLNEEQVRPWMIDFYDDAIADFDRQLQDLTQFLRQEKLLENTVLVVGSDHGMGHRAYERLPLMFRFPHGAHHGNLAANSQRIDVAPTLLDYMGLPIPPWMEGHSLLRQRDTETPIFSTMGGKREMDAQGLFRSVDSNPPYYSIGKIGMLICDNYWDLDLRSGRMRHRPVQDYSGPCPRPLRDLSVARSLIEAHLQHHGYPLSNPAAGQPVAHGTVHTAASAGDSEKRSSDGEFPRVDF